MMFQIFKTAIDGESLKFDKARTYELKEKAFCESNLFSFSVNETLIHHTIRNSWHDVDRCFPSDSIFPLWESIETAILERKNNTCFSCY